MSSIIQAKAEAQRLIKRYNKLQSEAKSADSAVEASRKASEAEKLVSQISALQSAITKLQAKDREKESATGKAATRPSAAKTAAPAASPVATKTLTDEEIKKVEEERNLLESRIARIEDSQKKTRAQIDQLSRAKAELARLKSEAEKNVVKERRANEEKLQQELAKLIDKKEAEQARLKTELDVIRQQANKDSELLKVQRDAARAMMEKQQQLERERISALRLNRGKKALWVGLGIGGISIAAFVVLVLVTSMFDSIEAVKNFKASLASSSETTKVESTPAIPAVTTTVPEERPQPKVVNTATLIKPIKVYRDRLKNGNYGPAMVQLPGGKFLMGASDSSPYSEEKPQHEVMMQGFSISKYEITFDEYDTFARAASRDLPNDRGWGRGNLPVVNVSWEDAAAYAKWLTEQTGRPYRLPTEREWEYAAKAGTEGAYWWGYELDKGRANCGMCGSQWDGKQPAPVGSFPANSAGLHDTVGNVMEWVLDCHRASYTGAPPFGNLWEGGKTDCSNRVVRGSSYRSYENALHVTKRSKYPPNSRIDTVGFRVGYVD